MCLCLAFLGLGTNIFAQKNDAYRNKNWHPEKGKYYFSSAITWQYNKHTETDCSKSIITIYLDSLSNTFLITPKVYGIGEEMVDFIIIDNSQNVFLGYLDHTGKYLEKYKFEKTSASASTLSSTSLSTSTQFKNSNKKISLTQTPLSQQNFFVYNKLLNSTSNVEEYATASTRLNFSILKLLSMLELEHPLPAILTKNTISKKNDLVVYVCTKYEELILLNWLPNQYFVDLKDYKTMK